MGPRTILSKLRRELETPPSRSAIYRFLVRHRLIAPKPRRRRREDYKRWERSRPMELWQIDIMGGVRLNGRHPALRRHRDRRPLGVLVIAKVVPRATARPVCDALLEALSRHGVPEQILTDNAKVFTGKLARTPASVLFDRICLNNGRILADAMRLTTRVLSRRQLPTTRDVRSRSANTRVVDRRCHLLARFRLPSTAAAMSA